MCGDQKYFKGDTQAFMEKKSIFRDKYVQVAVGMLILLVIAVVPLIIVGMYAHPCADDFSYGSYTHACWSTTHSLSQTLQWAIYQVQKTYTTWQGTFSSIFLMSLSPAIWGEGYYFLTPIIMLTMIIVPHFYLLKKMIVDVLNVSKTIWLITSSVVVFLMIETIVSPVEGLFWYNGSVHYVFMHGSMVTLFGLLLSLFDTKNRAKKVILCILACLCALLCGGSNYPTALLGILGTISLVMFLIWKRKQIYVVIPFLVYGVSFYLNVTAEGNKMRQAYFEKSSPVEAVVKSFFELFEYAINWMSIPILLFMLLMIPVFWELSNTEKYTFKFPAIATLLAICSNACMLTPGLYAMGSATAGRIMNIVKMWFILVLFFIEAYWIGWIKKKSLIKLPAKRFDIRIWMVVLFALLFVAFVFNRETRKTDYVTYAAYVTIRSGEAQQYHQEYLERAESLASEEKVVELEAFSVRPYLLFFDDITNDANDWSNVAMARWYSKDQVYLK